ncbi:MAG TPA: polysaccharide deacetylase family protein [Povalibacter sp.]|nr:polysaccharide deacetylase family protein [Povalibacter sp.]
MNSHEATSYGQQPGGPAAVVYLTFDDGPDPDWTPRILDELSRRHALATFFVIGECARRAPDLLRRIAAEGHAVGNHTLSHRHPWAMNGREARAQVHDGAAVIADILGQPARLYRSPHGRNRACMLAEAEQHGQSLVNWTMSAIDWGPLGTADRIASRLQRVQSGDIILMHDGRNRHNRPDELLRVLPAFLDTLAQRRLSPVPLN